MHAKVIAGLHALPMLAFLVACSSSGPTENAIPRIADATVAVSVGSENMTAIEAPFTKGTGAAAGAGVTATAGAVQGVMSSAAFGPLMVPVMPILAAVGAVSGAIVGGIIGSNTGLTEAEINESKAALEQALVDAFQDRNSGQRLADRLLAEARQHTGYRFALMADNSADSGDSIGMSAAHLEIAEARFGLRSGKVYNPPIELVLAVRVVATPSDGPDARIVREFTISRGPRPFVVWGQNGAALFRQALDEIIDDAASQIMFSLFTQYVESTRPDRITSARVATLESKDARIPVAGFEPVNPPVSITVQRRKNRQSEEEINFTIAATQLDPGPLVLSWQPFPGTYRPDPLGPPVPFVSSPAQNIENIKYDLEIWQLNTKFEFLDGWDYAWNLVYARSNIAGTTHMVEHLPCNGCKYAWTVRASFEFEGQTRVTQWSALSLPNTRISAFSGNSAGGDDDGWGGSHIGYHHKDLTRPWRTTPMPQVFYYPFEIK